jgi:hypothetical protein
MKCIPRVAELRSSTARTAWRPHRRRASETASAAGGKRHGIHEVLDGALPLPVPISVLRQRRQRCVRRRLSRATLFWKGWGRRRTIPEPASDGVRLAYDSVAFHVTCGRALPRESWRVFVGVGARDILLVQRCAFQVAGATSIFIVAVAVKTSPFCYPYCPAQSCKTQRQRQPPCRCTLQTLCG